MVLVLEVQQLRAEMVVQAVVVEVQAHHPEALEIHLAHLLLVVTALLL